MRGALPVLLLAALASCGGAGAKAPPGSGRSSPLRLAVEGPCPKLHVWDAGSEIGLVFGTYGLEGATPIEARTSLGASQAFGFLRKGKIEVLPALMQGLPHDARGYVPSDLDVGGQFPAAAWLARVDTNLARANKGALFERRRSYYVWETGHWTESPRGADVVLSGLRSAPFVEGTMCAKFGEDAHFARHATERSPTGEVITAGRCEDDLQRAKSGVMVAALARSTGEWVVSEMPTSTMFDEIVNVDLVYGETNDAYLYAYTPYDERPRPPYVQHYDGTRWSPVTLPFDGPVVSMARTEDGTIWAIARFREVYMHPPKGNWTRVNLPDSRFADRQPPDLRLIEVQTTGNDAWIHGAYPIVVRHGSADPTPSRSHILYTTRAWDKTLFCDANVVAKDALAGVGRTLEAAVSPSK